MPSPSTLTAPGPGANIQRTEGARVIAARFLIAHLAVLGVFFVPFTWQPGVAGFWPESGGPLAPPNVRSRTNVLFNAGGGHFALTTLIDMPIAVSRIAAGDLDGDGRNDLVVYGDEQCVVMMQSTTPGVFLPPRALR